MGPQMRMKSTVQFGDLLFGLAMSASRLTNKKVINILVGNESILTSATQPALIKIPVTPIASIRGSYICG